MTMISISKNIEKVVIRLRKDNKTLAVQKAKMRQLGSVSDQVAHLVSLRGSLRRLSHGVSFQWHIHAEIVDRELF
jgi:hypothetical protein